MHDVRSNSVALFIKKYIYDGAFVGEGVKICVNLDGSLVKNRLFIDND